MIRTRLGSCASTSLYFEHERIYCQNTWDELLLRTALRRWMTRKDLSWHDSECVHICCYRCSVWILYYSFTFRSTRWTKVEEEQKYNEREKKDAHVVRSLNAYMYAVRVQEQIRKVLFNRLQRIAQFLRFDLFPLKPPLEELVVPCIRRCSVSSLVWTSLLTTVSIACSKISWTPDISLLLHSTYVAPI